MQYPHCAWPCAGSARQQIHVQQCAWHAQALCETPTQMNKPLLHVNLLQHHHTCAEANKADSQTRHTQNPSKQPTLSHPPSPTYTKHLLLVTNPDRHAHISALERQKNDSRQRSSLSACPAAVHRQARTCDACRTSATVARTGASPLPPSLLALLPPHQHPNHLQQQPSSNTSILGQTLAHQNGHAPLPL